MSNIRNYNIDIAKTLAMVLVVMQHAWSMLDLDNPTLGLLCSAYRAIVTVGVPLFVFLSGALLLSRPIIRIKDFYKKRLVRLLIPFIILGLIVYLISLLSSTYTWWDGTWGMAINKYIPCLLNNEINIFHWYVHMLLVLYLLTPFLQRIVQTISVREYEFLMLGWALVMLLRQYQPQMYIISFISPLIKYLGVYLAGNYVAQYRTNKAKYLYSAIILSLIIYTINTLTDCSIQIGVPLMAIALGTLCLNIPKEQITSLKGTSIFVNISRYSYTIYLLHIILIRVIYNLTSMHYTSDWISVIPIFVTIIVMTIFYAGCWVYDKIKWLPNSLIGIG